MQGLGCWVYRTPLGLALRQRLEQPLCRGERERERERKGERERVRETERVWVRG